MAGITSFLLSKRCQAAGPISRLNPLQKLKLPFLGYTPHWKRPLHQPGRADIRVYVPVILVTLFWESRTSKWNGLSRSSGKIPGLRIQPVSPYTGTGGRLLQLNGVLGGLGGAPYAASGAGGNFSEKARASGRGYTKLSAVISWARYVPFGMMGAAFIFGADQCPSQIRPPGHRSAPCPQALAMLPTS